MYVSYGSSCIDRDAACNDILIYLKCYQKIPFYKLRLYREGFCYFTKKFPGATYILLCDVFYRIHQELV